MAKREQIPTLVGEMVKHQVGFNALSTKNAQAAILDMPAFIACACEAWTNRTQIQEPKVQETKGYLKLISGAETLTLDACEDSLISGSTEIFDGGIDPDFENYGCNVIGSSTGPTNVQVHEMVVDGTFDKIYASQGRELDSMCLTKGQIKSFVKKYRNWLRTDGYGTFFLFKVGAEFFVARVRFDSGRLRVRVFRFSGGNVWYADYRHRFVIRN
jgi:hypothetical protein